MMKTIPLQDIVNEDQDAIAAAVAFRVVASVLDAFNVKVYAVLRDGREVAIRTAVSIDLKAGAGAAKIKLFDATPDHKLVTDR